PSCSEPKNLSINAVTASGATLNWQAPNIGAATTYEYSVSTAAIPPVSGSAVNGLSANATGLMQNTLYYVFVRSLCGGGSTSDWAYTTFRTSCAATVNIPYMENFEGTVAPRPVPCIAVENTNKDVDDSGIPFTWTPLSGTPYAIGGLVSMVNGYNSLNTTIPA